MGRIGLIKTKLGIQRMKWIQNKYIVASICFFLWVMFFDENNVLEQFRYMRELKLLNNDKDFRIEQIQENSSRLKELKTSNENLEKFAREQYLMKKDNEDVFVLVEE